MITSLNLEKINLNQNPNFSYFPKTNNDCLEITTLEQIYSECNRCWSFLMKTHPYITSENDYAVVIRPLRNDISTNPWMKEHTIHNFTSEHFESFAQFIINIFKQKIAFSLYFSVYGIDVTIPALKANGELSKGSQLTKSNVHCTQILSADIDGLKPEHISSIYQKLLDLELETICLWSGHGLQFHVLLDKPCTDLLALSKFNDALKSNDLNIDLQVRDCSRILRLGFFNMKASMPDNTKYIDIIKVEELSNTNKRYDITEVFHKLGVVYTESKRPFDYKRADLYNNPNVLESYPYADEHAGFTPKKQKIKKELAPKSILPKVISPPKGVQHQLDTINLQALYPILHIEQLSVGFKNMLYGFRPGFADNSLMFIVGRLHHYGFTQNQIHEITNTLAELDTFNWAWDTDTVATKTDYFYNMGIHNVPIAIFNDLEAEFGTLRTNFTKTKKEVELSKVNIPRSLFTYQPNTNGNPIAKIKSAAFVLYLNLLLDSFLFKHNNPGIHKAYSEQDIIELSGRKRIATREALQNLTAKAIDNIQIKLISKKKSINKKAGEGYRYFLNPISSYNGCIKYEYDDLQHLLNLCKEKKISNSALALYFYLIFRIAEKDEQTIAQSTMSFALGISQSQIQRLLSELEISKLIIIYKGGYRDTNRYCILNYTESMTPIVRYDF